MSEGFSIEPGREEEFRYLQGWLAFSDRLDRLIEATEWAHPPEQAQAPVPVLSAAAQFAAAQPAAVRADAPRERATRALVRAADRALRRMGESLEAQGSPAPTLGRVPSRRTGLGGGRRTAGNW